VLVFVFLLMLSALVIATTPRAEPEVVGEKQWPVSYREVVPQSLSPQIQIYGKLETEQTATLRAAISGTVAQIHFREGDWVEQGDILLSLADQEMQLAVQSAQAEVMQAQAHLGSVKAGYKAALELSLHHEAQAALSQTRLERFVSLHQQRMIADAQLDEVRQEVNERAMTLARHKASVEDFPHQIAQAEATLSAATTRLARAQLELGYTQLNAPFSGRVLDIGVAEGDRIVTGTSMLSIADYSRLRMRAAVVPTLAQQLREALGNGQPLIAQAELEGRKLHFEMTGLAGDIRPGNGGLDVFFRVDLSAELALGLVLPLSLELPPVADVIAVPLHAVYDNTRLYRIVDNRLQALDIQRVGEYQDAGGHYQLLVRSPGIHAGDHIMMSQLPTAVSGLLVDPIAADSQVMAVDSLALQ
jgi:multidrug efflux pump subunit AcrA (membrane-fusion protein)